MVVQLVEQGNVDKNAGLEVSREFKDQGIYATFTTPANAAVTTTNRCWRP